MVSVFFGIIDFDCFNFVMILWCIFVDYIVKIYYFEFVVFFVVFWLDMSKVDLMEGVVLKVVRVEWG